MSRRKPGPTSLAALLDRKHLIVLVGEGGVGKTSAAAALAFERALRGATVSVLTIDPAPRLGDALGIEAIDAQPRAVALPAGAGGSLTAMRLDSKATFDRMVERHSPSPAVAEALLANPLYRTVSEQLGGTENYMAFQRLNELVESGGNDCLVVDTPPAADAAELLAAPTRLTGLLDTSAMSILADPARIVARAGSVIARATFTLILGAVERVTGASLRSQVTEFVALFAGLITGLEERARSIDQLLRAPETAFVLVTRPRAADVERALAFRDSLAAMGIGVAAVLVNRVTPERGSRDKTRLASLSPELHDAVVRMEADMDALRAIERHALARLRARLSARDDPAVFCLEARDLDIASLEDVAGLAAELGRPAVQPAGGSPPVRERGRPL